MGKIELSKQLLERMILSGSTTPASTVYGYEASGSPISLTPEDEATHTMVLGATGSGKTMMASGAIAQNILRGSDAGSMLICDPLGAMADYTLDFLGHVNCLLRLQELGHPYRSFRSAAGRKREELADRIIYLPFGEKGVGGHRLNLLNLGGGFSLADSVGVTIKGLEQTVGSTMELMRQLFNILRSGLTVAAQLGRSFAGLEELLLMKSSELERLVRQVARRFPGVNGRDAYEHRFFEGFVAATTGKERRELVKSTLNICQPVLSNPRLCEVFASGPSTIDLCSAIEDGKIIIVSAPPGGDFTTGKIACSMMLNAVVAAVNKRPANARAKGYPPVRIYADEYHTFADLEWLSLQLSTIRNRNAMFSLFSQSLHQYPFSDPQMQRLAQGLRANTRTLICLSVTAPDAAEVGPELFQLDGQMVARVRVRETFSEGESLALAFSETVSRSLGLSEGESEGESTAASHGSTEGESSGTSRGTSITLGLGSTHTQGRNSSRTVAHGISVSTANGQTVVESTGTADGTSDGESHGDFQGVSAGMPEGVLYSSLDGQKRQSDGQSDGVSSSVSRVESAARALGQTMSTTQSETKSNSTTEGASSSESQSETFSRATSQLSSAMKSLSKTLTETHSKSRQRSSSTTETTGSGRGKTETLGRSRSRSREEVTDYRSVAEEKELKTQQLVALRNREFFMRKPDGTLVRGKTADLPVQPQYKIAGFDGKVDLLKKSRPSEPAAPLRPAPVSDPSLSFLRPVPEELE